MRHETVLVTGGAGFIGSAVVRRLVGYTKATVLNVDKLTYAGNLDNLVTVAGQPNYRFIKADIADDGAMTAAIAAARAQGQEVDS